MLMSTTCVKRQIVAPLSDMIVHGKMAPIHIVDFTDRKRNRRAEREGPKNASDKKNGRRRGGAVTSVRSISSWAAFQSVGGKRFVLPANLLGKSVLPLPPS